MSKRKRTSSRGFTIIEVLTYLMLFSLISLFIMQMLIQTMKSFNAFRASRENNDAAIYVMERLTRDVRRSTSINGAQSVLGTSPGRLSLNTVNASGTAMTIEYVVATSTLRVRENGDDQGALTLSRTKVTELTFNTATSTASTTALRIKLRLETRRSAITTSNYFSNTILLRGTY